MGAGRVQRHHTGLLRQHLANGGWGYELRPIALQRFIKLQVARFNQFQRADRHEWLADRVGLNQAVRRPWRPPTDISETAPEIHYEAAVAPDGKRGTSTTLLL